MLCYLQEDMLSLNQEDSVVISDDAIHQLV